LTDFLEFTEPSQHDDDEEEERVISEASSSSSNEYAVENDSLSSVVDDDDDDEVEGAEKEDGILACSLQICFDFSVEEDAFTAICGTSSSFFCTRSHAS
jgi:hypothetical protein